MTKSLCTMSRNTSRNIVLSVVLLCIILLMYFAASIMKIFIVALVLTYALYPLVLRCSQLVKIPYHICAVLIFLSFWSIITYFILHFSPLLYQQVLRLGNKIPQYQESFNNTVIPYFLQKVHIIDDSYFAQINTTIKNSLNEIVVNALNWVDDLWVYMLSMMHIIGLYIFMPFLSFYFLYDCPKILRSIKNLCSDIGYSPLFDILSDIDKLLGVYIRGILTVCMFLSIYYSISLLIIGFDFAIVFGVVSGFALLLPFIGPVLAFTSAAVISYLSNGFTNEIWMICGIYLGAQVIEGAFLTPKIIGRSIGIHPTMIVFSVLICGQCFGFLGVVFALPIAGVVKILLQYAWECKPITK